MSSEQILSVSDLRAAAQDYKRDEEQKKKWAFGSRYVSGRGEAHPRPMRASDNTFGSKNRYEKQASVKDSNTGKAKLARKQDMLSAGDDYASSEDSSASAEEDVDAESTAPALDAHIMYSFDASRAPTQGSQILNAALAKAIDKYEDNQTTKLVQTEYDVLDNQADDEDSLGMIPSKSKGKARMVDAEDQEYEFV